MLKLLFVLLLLMTLHTGIYAQSYQKLDQSYSLELPKTPFDTIQLLKNNVPIQLKPGRYLMPHLGRFGYYESEIIINDKGKITRDFIAQKNKNGKIEKAMVTVKDNKLSSIAISIDDTLKFRFAVKDSATIEQDYWQGELNETTTTFYTNKNYGKKIIKHHYSNGSYLIENEIDSTNISYTANHKLAVWANRYKKEQKNFDTLGQLKMHVYQKGGIQYWEHFENGKIESRSYEKQYVSYKETYKNGKLYQTTTRQRINDKHIEIKTYDAKKTLIKTMLEDAPIELEPPRGN